MQQSKSRMDNDVFTLSRFNVLPKRTYAPKLFSNDMLVFVDGQYYPKYCSCNDNEFYAAGMNIYSGMTCSGTKAR